MEMPETQKINVFDEEKTTFEEAGSTETILDDDIVTTRNRYSWWNHTDVDVCLECGSLVSDREKHDAFHAR